MDKFSVGDAQIHRIEELTTHFPFASFNASEEIIESNAHWLRPHWLGDDDTWEMVVQSWIVLVDDRVVVVDPCVGNGRILPEFDSQDFNILPMRDEKVAFLVRADHPLSRAGAPGPSRHRHAKQPRASLFW